MAGVNKVIVLGNLGADPEVRVLSTGAKVARLRIATSETYTNKAGERVTNTEWHSVNVWRGQADVAEKYLAKGRQVYIEGKLRTRSYDDKEGITRYVTEIEADTLTLIGGRPDGDNSGGGGQQTQAQPQQQKAEAKKPAAAKNLQPDSADDESFDDLPF
ncbi:MAG: single-stranded DNA-binding protein [Flavobacteriales bacterium]|nr:single-stranded DNA-binding protein [Flavobacteriales bacterium]